ncbi:MAG: KUP/HAK/KT family potassium transporter [Bacteroidales bacterium]
MSSKVKTGHIHKLTFTGLIITLGIVYGDLGTSPLYVFRAIVNGAGGVSREVILGGISCIFWTLTLQTTLKYVLITLRADNKGEGGILALYALIRKKAKWAFVFAIIGGSTLLADGIITPAITVVSAVEGLNMVNDKIPILPIVLIIITVLFAVQQYGTNKLGESFGPIMFVWFTMLGTLGMAQIIKLPGILESVNPVYAFRLLSEHPGGYLLLGAVFLCTTGADALYSDLGHCGVRNLRVSWIYVKISLILNYMGQGAWLLSHPNTDTTIINPFYSIMPSWFIMTGIVVATIAAIIASQAMITSSFTIISEAILLNFWPKVQINYPTQVKGQMYVPSVNRFLWFACVLVILFFQKSINMEAAYGLTINITMLMTTILMGLYLYYSKLPSLFSVIFVGIYLIIEGTFLASNLNKFTHGGWATFLIAGLMFSIMYIWYRGRNIKNRFISFSKIGNYLEWFKDLKEDESVPKYATNLVYLTKANFKQDIESKVIYSIFNKQPKRADLYWLIHIDILDEPHTMNYKVETLIPDTLIRVDFKLGFKVQTRINLYFKQVIQELLRNNEVDITSRYDSLRKHHVPGDFKFVIIDRIQNYDFDFKAFEQLIMDVYAILKNIGVSDTKAYGLDTSNVYVEKVPLQFDEDTPTRLRRIY